MSRKLLTYRLIATFVAPVLVAACTTQKQETPSLTGPSGLGTSLVLAVSPDVLAQDGASQSLVQIQAYDSNGQPLRSVSMRVDIAVGDTLVDFGKLSARSVVTDSNGRASVTYTAPPPVGGGVPVPATDVQILVTPSSTDAANSTARFATIRVVPTGTTVPPRASVTATFTANPTAPTDHQPVLFDASASKSTTGTITSWQWNFGDGSTGSGETVSHSFNSSGDFEVKLTVTDSIGASNFTSQKITVGRGTNPAADFFVSPSSPVVDQQVFFNATNSQPTGNGRSLVAYDWDFGDGSTGTGVTASHRYGAAGTYTVALTVTDDAGHKGVKSQSLVVGSGNPNAQITVSPPSGKVGDTISLIGSQSTTAPGRTIVSYAWNFGDNSTGSGATTSHRYLTAGTFTVTLVVTDDQGRQGIATATVTIAP